MNKRFVYKAKEFYDEEFLIALISLFLCFEIDSTWAYMIVLKGSYMGTTFNSFDALWIDLCIDSIYIPIP